MSKLIYAAISSLDGYIEDERGEFGWARPDEGVHAFVNELLRPIGTHLYGRRMYETMAVWETIFDDAPVMRDFAEIWRSAEKVVFSRTLEEVGTARTRLVREFRADEVRAMLETADRDMTIAGPGLAAAALAAGLVDEIHAFLVPFATGGGKPSLAKGLPLALELLDERRFAGGTVYLRYRILQASRKDRP